MTASYQPKLKGYDPVFNYGFRTSKYFFLFQVCLDKPAVVVFIPCAHICCCMDCTQALRMCPICRMKIEKAVRTYTS